jgi:Asp-tRNA(Asn)/Glu-tRNA(Gln) amidotransferase A subunit family amidase
VDAAVDAALAAAGVRTAEVTGLDFAAAADAANVLIDAEAYQVNAYLLPHRDRLTRGIQHNLAEAAAITPGQVASAERTRQAVRDWFTGMLARHPFLALPTLTGAPPLLGQRGMSLTVLTMPANLAGLPALALPVPGGPDGLPASLQLIGPPRGEEQLIALARLIESAISPLSAWPRRARAPRLGVQRRGSYPSGYPWRPGRLAYGVDATAM